MAPQDFSARWGGHNSRKRGRGCLVAIWFVLMLSSVGLAYYFYLKSERWEREVRQLRQAAGLTATQQAPEVRTVIIPEGVPVEAVVETTGTSVAGVSEPAAEAVGSPTPSPPPPVAVQPSPSPKSQGTISTPQETRAPVERSEERAKRDNIPKPADSPAEGEEGLVRPTASPTREAGRSGRIGSIYDVQKTPANR